MLASQVSADAQCVGLRPEHIQIVAAGQGVAATVVLAEHLGDSSIIHCRVEGVTDLVSAKIGTEQNRSIETGQMLGLAPDPAWALVFDANGRLKP